MLTIPVLWGTEARGSLRLDGCQTSSPVSDLVLREKVEQDRGGCPPGFHLPLHKCVHSCIGTCVVYIHIEHMYMPYTCWEIHTCLELHFSSHWDLWPMSRTLWSLTSCLETRSSLTVSLENNRPNPGTSFRTNWKLSVGNTEVMRCVLLFYSMVFRRGWSKMKDST